MMNIVSKDIFLEMIRQNHNLSIIKYSDFYLELKNQLKLIEKQNQFLILLKKGSIVDKFQESFYTTLTKNISVYSQLKCRKFDFKPLFKAGVYFLSLRDRFFSKKRALGYKIISNPHFGPILIKTLGNYYARIADVSKFFSKYLGISSISTIIFGLEHQLRYFTLPVFAEVLNKN